MDSKNNATDRLYELTCAHCTSVFLGNYRRNYQANKKGQKVCCSDVCRAAIMRSYFETPVPTVGPCQHCGSMFSSRNTEKKYCNMACYTASAEFKERLNRNTHNITAEAIKRNAEKRKLGENIECLECKQLFYQKLSKKSVKKFCGRPCYRSYLSKRFDRFIANPESVALPQNYDEFLDREELPCMVNGCGWVGKHLAAHVNIAHGIKALDFKRAAGFNLSTGLVSRDLSERMSARALQGVAKDTSLWQGFPDQQEGSYVRYHSLEGREHQAKARAMAGNGPTRSCKGCGGAFVQSTVFGQTKYCSRVCRSAYYARNFKRKAQVARHEHPNS